MRFSKIGLGYPTHGPQGEEGAGGTLKLDVHTHITEPHWEGLHMYRTHCILVLYHHLHKEEEEEGVSAPLYRGIFYTTKKLGELGASPPCSCPTIYITILQQPILQTSQHGLTHTWPRCEPVLGARDGGGNTHTHSPHMMPTHDAWWHFKSLTGNHVQAYTPHYTTPLYNRHRVLGTETYKCQDKKKKKKIRISTGGWIKAVKPR